MFTGAISFRVVGCRHFQFYTCQFGEGLPESQNKQFVMITYNIVWQSIFTIPIVEKYYGEVLCSDIGLSVIVRIQLKLLSVGNGPTKSMAMLSPWLSGTGTG